MGIMLKSRWSVVGDRQSVFSFVIWWHCFKRQWREIGITLLSFGAYFGTGHIPSLKAHRVPATALDHAVPLLPWTAYGYVSLYPLLVANLVYFVPRPRALRPLLQAMTLANTLGGLVFVTYRTTVPRPPLPISRGSWLLGRIWQVDPPHNAVPSLHTTYSVLIALVHWRWHSPYRAIVLPWCGLIIATTLTTKQHQVVDVVAGIALASIIGRLIVYNAAADDIMAEATTKTM